MGVSSWPMIHGTVSVRCSERIFPRNTSVKVLGKDIFNFLDLLYKSVGIPVEIYFSARNYQDFFANKVNLKCRSITNCALSKYEVYTTVLYILYYIYCTTCVRRFNLLGLFTKLCSPICVKINAKPYDLWQNQLCSCAIL